MEQRSSIGLKKKGTKHSHNTAFMLVDTYGSYKKEGGKLGIHDYRAVIRELNELIAEQLAIGKKVILPCRFGSLGARKIKKKLQFENGKITNTYSVDWGRTKKLWKEDEQAYKDKILVKLPTEYDYYVYWYKGDAKFKYKSIYDFKPVRSLKLKTRQYQMAGEMDAIPIIKIH